MEKYYDRFKKIFIISFVLSAICFGLVIAMNLAAPNPLFSYLAGGFLFFLAISFISLVLATIIKFKHSIDNKNYLEIFLVILMLCIWAWVTFFRK